MARQLRLEYAGAIDHVMSREGRQEACLGKLFDVRRDARPTIKPPKVAFPRDFGDTESLGVVIGFR